MKRVALVLLLLGTAFLRANPVAAPAVVMTAENVIVTVSQDAILVAGLRRIPLSELERRLARP